MRVRRKCVIAAVLPNHKDQTTNENHKDWTTEDTTGNFGYTVLSALSLNNMYLEWRTMNYYIYKANI